MKSYSRFYTPDGGKMTVRFRHLLHQLNEMKVIAILIAITMERDTNAYYACLQCFLQDKAIGYIGSLQSISANVFSELPIILLFLSQIGQNRNSHRCTPPLHQKNTTLNFRSGIPNYPYESKRLHHMYDVPHGLQYWVLFYMVPTGQSPLPYPLQLW